ncbi:Mis12 [Drosophila busckii]|uniref:Mis12 n=1 Tax=Drosophila busckii TaxID=30019 RepID=A0A0M3QT23_DROBS|nr:uncharacterized protein LOC108608391 [Drosophila busckii]XP_017855234.1 uncharacterized protein LOC108608391 [Drosophila busckii]XP_017855235.1 uncharacterized protein LOC108608391 [Drosophila busckii]ALC38163.1 Mis12 [Drosophila busckii]
MDLNQLAYSLDLFNFTSEQISAEREMLVQTLIGRAVDSTIKKIETPATSALLMQQRDEVMRLMLKCCKPKLHALRKLDKRTFTVPPHVLQIKDFDVEKKISSAQEQDKSTELQQLKERFSQNMAMLEELEAEQKKFTSLEQHIQHELQMHKQIHKICGNTELQNVYKFATDLTKDEKLL